MLRADAAGLRLLRVFALCPSCRHYPGAADGRSPRSFSPSRISLPRKGHRVGLHIVLFEIPWRLDSDRRSDRVRSLNPPTLETTMQVVADRAEAPTAIQTDLRAIFVSLELSRSTWLITSLSPGGGEKMSKHSIQAGDIAGLLKR